MVSEKPENKQLSIPVYWILNYIDTLLEYSSAIDQNSAMSKATRYRAENIMDMLDTWKENASTKTHT